MISAKEIFCLNEKGRRQNNEDHIYPPKGTATTKDNLFIVCDGVGGENKGEVASEIVCKSIYNYISGQPYFNGIEKETIEKSITYANLKLAEHAAGDSAAKRMSTTLSLVLLGEQSIIAAWCGDTRIHHIREGKVIWKSDDHSLVNELVKSGEITEEEANSHPKKNIITRSLNALNYNNLVDYHEITNFKTDDYLLLCTDGLLEQINEDRICTILNNEKEENKARHFLSYCEGKTKDNFSMYLIRVSNNVPKNKEISATFRPLFISTILLICLASIIVMYLKLKEHEIVSKETITEKKTTKKSPGYDTLTNLKTGIEKSKPGKKP